MLEALHRPRNLPAPVYQVGFSAQQKNRLTDINALAETINGLYKAEVIHRCGPWRSFEAVEFATLQWVDCSTPPPTEPIGNMPPAEAEARYYAQTEVQALAA